MSAWEPCGGILCANLPLVYRSILHMLRNVRTTILNTSRRRTTAGGASGSGGSGGTQRSSLPVLSNEWKRLEGSGGLGVDENPTVSEVYAFKGKNNRGGNGPQDFEMDTVGPGKIVVSRTFHQDL